jgi:crossover junction endodeoxyribonuclease RuvC
MAVIGIDPGTAITGYGIIEEAPDGSLSTLAYGVIETTPDLDMPSRLVILYHKLKELLLLHQPNSAAVEKLFFQRNVRTALSVGQARGVALLTLAEYGISIGEYTPLVVKQAVAGYGGADKHQVQVMVRTILGLAEIPKPDDAADALAIAICHLHSRKYLQMVSRE